MLKIRYLYIITAAILLTGCGRVEIAPKNDISIPRPRTSETATAETTAPRTLHTEAPAAPTATAETAKTKSKSAAKDKSAKKKQTATAGNTALC